MLYKCIDTEYSEYLRGRRNSLNSTVWKITDNFVTPPFDVKLHCINAKTPDLLLYTKELDMAFTCANKGMRHEI